MPRIILLLILGIFFTPTAGHSEGEAQIVTEGSLKGIPVWDFGEIKAGQVANHSFVLRNDSAKTLNIKDVSTSCGCTVSEIKKKTLQPNEATEIQVKFNSKGYSGLVEQSVYVTTDNLDRPVLRFIIKALVK